MVATKAQGLLYFFRDYELSTKACLPSKRIVEDLPNHRFYILFTTTLNGPLRIDEEQVLGRFTDNIDKIDIPNR